MRILKIFLSILLLLIFAVIALIFFLPGERIAAIAADQIKAQTGRNIAFDGDVAARVFPNLSIETGPVSFSNASWSTGGPMFQADSSKIGVDIFSLIGGNIRIKEVTLIRPTVLLEVDESGVANWDFGAADGNIGSATSEKDNADENTAGRLMVEQLKVLNAEIKYRDQLGTRFEISDFTANFSWGDGPAEIELLMVPAGEPVQVAALIEDLNALIAGEVTRLDVKVKAEGNELEFDGLGSIVPELSGKLDLELPEPDEFFTAIGLKPAGLPSISADGDLTLTKDKVLSLRGGDITVLGNALSVDADVDFSEKPNVMTSISADQLDLTALLGNETATSGAASSGWPTTIIDASALALFDGNISLAANAIDTGSLKFEGSRVSIAVSNARAVATLHQLSGYGGAVAGEFVVNNRNGLSVGGAMNLTELALKPLLTDLVEIESFTGDATAQISFLGVGNSIDKIMKSLRGDGALRVGQGTISGMDLDQLFRGAESGGTTVFDSLNARWTIEEGDVLNDDLRMELPSLLAKGAGRIGLGAQDVDYTLAPQIRNEAETGFAVPVRVKGTWENPQIWPDLEAVIEQNFDEEVKNLQQKATDAAADKLGVTVEEGEELGKTLEKKLEEEVTKGLKNLLGRN